MRHARMMGDGMSELTLLASAAIIEFVDHELTDVYAVPGTLFLLT